MKIIFANKYYFMIGGTERVFFDEIELLESSGHQIVPFARGHHSNIPTSYSKYFPDELVYTNISSFKKLVVAQQMVYSFECRKAFSRLIDLIKPDILHLHSIYGILTSSIIDAAYNRGIPIVMTLHDYNLICPTYRFLSDGVICEKCINSAFYHAAIDRCSNGQLFPSLLLSIQSYFFRIFKKHTKIK